MSEPVSTTYARAYGILDGGILGTQPLMGRAMASLGELYRRDPSPLLKGVMDELGWINESLAAARRDAEATVSIERAKRELGITDDTEPASTGI